MARYSLITLAIMSISACSTVEQRQVANGNFDYVQEQPVISLKVPADLESPVYSDEYKLPPVSSNLTSDVGEAVKITAPALVLPLVVGSHVEEGLKEATVLFDQVDDSQPLDTAIWNSLISYLEEQGIGVSEFDKDNHKLVTDWVLLQQGTEQSWYDWSDVQAKEIGMRFTFELDMKPHGRTAALKARLTDYLESQGDMISDSLSPDEKRRNEVEALNKVIGHYAYQIRVADSQRQQQIRKGLALEMGFDSNGEAAFVVGADFDMTWLRMQLVLRKLGFNVKDLDNSAGLLFVEYEGVDAGWWDSLWGADENELPIDKDDYRVQLGDLGSKTSITILSEDNVPMSADFMTSIHSSFASVMATDDLDL